jgi:hypothetical protein
MSSQIFKKKIPSEIFFNLLKTNSLNPNEKYTIFNNDSYKKGFLNNSIPEFIELCKDYYHISKYLLDKGADGNLTNDLGHIAVRGLEGDKSLAFAQFVSSLNGAEVLEALENCEKNIELLDKVVFAGSGLRLKKNLGAEWTDEIQAKFKSITQKL